LSSSSSLLNSGAAVGFLFHWRMDSSRTCALLRPCPGNGATDAKKNFSLPKDPALLHLVSSPLLTLFLFFHFSPLVPARSTSAFLHIDVVGMAHSEMSGERIISAECLLLGTQMTPHLLLSCIMNCIFVSREIVRSRKDGVARLPRRGVDPLALVGSVLCVAKRR